MGDATICLICFLTLLFIIYYFYYDNNRIIVKGYTGKLYSIRNRIDEFTNSSQNDIINRLDEIILRINKLCDALIKDNYPDKERAERTKQRWDNIVIKETHKDEKSVAFVINKGDELSVCLTNKETGELEDINTTMFVVLHEVGHLMSVNWGHDDEFWTNFKYILRKAQEIDIYNYTNYNNTPEKYCGISIYSNPCMTQACAIPST
tara:strand:+ start:421 stop:1038 length:618 start_codon:yes stop_codon:yes gene_type:complete